MTFLNPNGAMFDMKTKPLYYEDAYLRGIDSKVLSIEPKGSLTNIVLDQTIFYPEGGGQPSDRGKLGAISVEFVRLSNDEITHQAKGTLKVGKTVHAVLDWHWRYKHMKLHSAGHLLHDVISGMFTSLRPLGASHGKESLYSL